MQGCGDAERQSNGKDKNSKLLITEFVISSLLYIPASLHPRIPASPFTMFLSLLFLLNKLYNQSFDVI